jgi:hypothetical protein
VWVLPARDVPRTVHGVDIQRNIRLFLPLMVNVECRVSHQLFNQIRRRAQYRKRYDE